MAEAVAGGSAVLSLLARVAEVGVIERLLDSLKALSHCNMIIAAHY